MGFWEKVGFIFIMWFVLPLGIIFFFLVLGGLICAGVDEYKHRNDPQIILKTRYWSCTKEHEYVTTTMVMAGKVMVPVTTTHHDCINWAHK